MSRSSPRCKPVPAEVRQTADLLERRWQLSVIYAALTGALRFNQRGVANPAVEQAIGSEDRAISVITVSELLHGVHRAKGAQRTRRGAFVEHLLAELQAIPITETVARVHADVWARPAARGQVIGAHDLW